MTYIVDPTNPLTPTDLQDALQGAEEFRALKGRVNTVAGMVGVGGIASMDKNMLINGTAEIDQINEGSVYESAGAGIVATLDCWSITATGTGTLRIQKVADPSFPASFAFKLLAFAADAALAAADNYIFHQIIEGYRVARLGFGAVNAKSATLSFWVEGMPAGTYSVSLRNAATDRSYIAQFIVSSVARQQIQVTIPGDVTGTWTYVNGSGILVTICLGAGSDFQGVAGWQAGSKVALATNSNFMATINNVAYISQIQLEVGNIATDFEIKNRDERLFECQRYYEKSYNQGVAPGTVTLLGANYLAGAAFLFGAGPCKVEKRTTPAVALYSPTTGTAGNWTDVGGVERVTTPQNIGFSGPSYCNIATSPASAQGHWTCNARLS